VLSLRDALLMTASPSMRPDPDLDKISPLDVLASDTFLSWIVKISSFLLRIKLVSSWGSLPQ